MYPCNVDKDKEVDMIEMVEKQAQEYCGKVPLIILGSGASAAYGLPSMGALAEHLMSHIDSAELHHVDLAAWSQFCTVLQQNIDLETALHQVQMSSELTQKIVNTTWQLIQSADLKIFNDFLAGSCSFTLGRLLKHFFRSTRTKLNIITTNYDRLAEYACEQEGFFNFTGFYPGLYRRMAQPDEVRVVRQVDIWKVHGSIDWFQTDKNEIVGIAGLTDIPFNHTPQIVTPGTQKYQRTHQPPYRTIIQQADNAIEHSSAYLCIGYGFNDEHIQPKLLKRCARDEIPIVVITHTLTNATRQHILSGAVEKYLVIERGQSDNHSLVYSSLIRNAVPMEVERNLWALDGFLTLII